MATIRDLADYTGFSVTTISRVLNNDPTMSVPDVTREKILEAASALHYKTTGSKKQKPVQRPLHIALVEMLSKAEQLHDPYYLYLRESAVKCCMERGHNVSFIFEKNGRYQRLGDTELDGIVAVGIFSEEQIQQLQCLCPRIVFLDSAPDELRFDSVVLNFQLGVQLAVDYLIECGHRHIGFLGPSNKLDQRKRNAPEARLGYFADYMQRLGLYDEALVLDTQQTPAQTREAVIRWSEETHPTPAAFLAYNEETAITAVSALRERGLRVPEDISIVSINDTPLSILIEPPLTSINTHMDITSEAALDLLTARISAPDRLPRKIVIPMTLTERSSVAQIGQ